MTGGTATNHFHQLEEAATTGDYHHHGNDAITNGTDKDNEAATGNTMANEHGTNNENGHKTTEMGEENRPKRKVHHDDGSKNDDVASQGGEKQEEDDHGGSVSVEKRPRTMTNNNTSTVTDALQVIWQSLEDDPSDSNNKSNNKRTNVMAVQVAVKETAALLLQSYNDLIQPATKAMIDLEETKKRLHMLQNTLVSKDREIERLQQSEKQARTSIAVSNLL
jgi:hypothetical protein